MTSGDPRSPVAIETYKREEAEQLLRWVSMRTRKLGGRMIGWIRVIEWIIVMQWIRVMQ